MALEERAMLVRVRAQVAELLNTINPNYKDSKQ